MTGYSMDTARKIIGHSPVHSPWNDNEPDRAALLELERMRITGEHDSVVLLSCAFNLGHAAGVRDERNKHNPIVAADVDEVSYAMLEVQKAEREAEFLSLTSQLNPKTKEQFCDYLRKLTASV